MTRTRRRSFSVAIVALAIVAGSVFADVEVVPAVSGTGSARTGIPLRLVTMLHNPATTALTVNIVPRVIDPGCTGVTVRALDDGLMPRSLGALETLQVIVEAASGVPMTRACVLDVTGMPGMATTFTANFTISGAPGLDAEPSTFKFVAPSGGSDTQTLVLSNYGTANSPSLSVTIEPESLGIIALQHRTCMLNPCPVLPITGGGSNTLDFVCGPPMGEASNGNILVRDGGSVLHTIPYTCVGSGGPGMLTIDPEDATIGTPPMMTGSTSLTIAETGGTNDNAISELTATGDTSFFTFPDLLVCYPSCDALVTSTLVLPFGLRVECTPNNTTMRSILITVKGINGAADVDTATVTCVPSTGPILQYNPTTVTVTPSPQVGVTSQQHDLDLTNTGAGALSVVLSVPPEFADEWSFVPPCSAAAPCVMTGTGSSQRVQVRLTPEVHGPRDTTLTLTTNETTNPVHSANLVGTGRGAFLEVTDPEDLTFTFGTIPSSQTGQQPIQLRNSGNEMTNVTIQPSPTTPFGASTGTVALAANGGAGTFTATCASAGPFDGSGTYTLSGSAYNAPITLTATCTVVDTPITIDPLRFEFGELRTSDEPKELPFAITNPTTTVVEVANLTLANAPMQLELEVTGGMTTVMLAGGATLTGVVRLVPSGDVEIADDVALEFTADGTTLSLPISGSVGTPRPVIDPITLDLGTACVGSPATGTIRLHNLLGTASFVADAPVMDQSFVTRLGSVPFPATVRPGDTVSVDVQPAETAIGAISGKLSWQTDVEVAPLSATISLDYIDAGVAVSPQRHSFAQPVLVGETSERRIVTLENCNAEPLTLTIAGVVATAGGADAWEVEPRNEQQVLAPSEKLRVMVRFAPKQRGVHMARIAVTAGDQPADIELSGFAEGPLEATSFYACSCSGGSAGGGGPIVVALGFVVLRRRRRHRS